MGDEEYRKLLEGLEVSIINFKELQIDNEKYRYDSDFFQKKYLNAYLKIKSKKNYKLVDIVDTLSDFHANGSYETIAKNFRLLDEPSYAYMVRTTDLESNNFENNVKYVDENSYNYLSKSQLKGGELLINKIGTPGKTYLMPILDKKVSLGMNLFMLRMKTGFKINEKLIWLFFQTELGNNIIKRKVNGTVPLTIDKEAIKSLYVPCFDEEIIEQIELVINNSEQLNKNSKLLFIKAEELLLKSVGLQNYTPGKKAVNIKSFKESFLQSGRLDAEYYQPKYEEIIAKISQFENLKICELVTIEKSIEPGSGAYQEEGIPFIRVSNLSKFGLSKPEIHLDRKEFGEIIKPKKDTILLSKDGSVGIAYKVSEDMDCITSGAILHLSVTNPKVNADYLTLVLNSKLVQLQAERDAGGSIIQHWKPSEIQQVIIPIIAQEIQTEIAVLVQKSFALKQQSEKLLYVAKRAVEIAIEENEEIAMEYINHNNQ